MPRFPLIAIGVALAAGLAGCGSARMSDRQSDKLFREGRYSEAAQRLKEGMDKQGEDSKDKLLYLFDIGLALHLAGQYEESNKMLLEAERMSEIKDYTSLANEAATLIVSDNIKEYSGEDFEKVMVNVYLAMNFALTGQYEAAIVEARKVNRKLYLMVSEGKRQYKQNAFAQYLSGILFESQGEWNDAYVDYKKTRNLMPGLPGLGRDLFRMAELIGAAEDAERWDKEFNLSAEDKRIARLRGGKSRKSEIIVVYENGISPIKRPHRNMASVPEFYPRANPVREATVAVDGKESGRPVMVHDIEATAIQNLQEKYAAIIAKKVAGAVTKAVVADQIGQKAGKGWGDLARLVMFAADQADCRSWNLLPRDLQVLRVPVEPGLHTVRLTPIGGRGPLEKTIQVAAGKKVFVGFRYMP